MRDTFMKVGQSLMVKKQLVNEKGLKEKMIHSVMPPRVADWLMKVYGDQYLSFLFIVLIIYASRRRRQFLLLLLVGSIII